MKFEIYTDGCCVPNPGKGSYGYVKLSTSGDVTKFVNLDSEITTNNRMEYKAIIEAIKSCSFDDVIEIHSDSMLAVNTFNLWMDKWESLGKVSKKKNSDLVLEMIDLKKKYHYVKLSWIKGHNGHQWNELVDELVNSALKG